MSKPSKEAWEAAQLILDTGDLFDAAALLDRFAAEAQTRMFDQFWDIAACQYGIAGGKMGPEELLRRVAAMARLKEFDTVINERPIDPCYWDKHHRAELERLAAGGAEPMTDKPETLESVLVIGDEINQCLQIIITNAGNIGPKQYCVQVGAIEKAVRRAAMAVQRLAPIAARLRERDNRLQQLVKEMNEMYSHASDYSATGVLRWFSGKLEAILGGKE